MYSNRITRVVIGPSLFGYYWLWQVRSDLEIFCGKCLPTFPSKEWVHYFVLCVDIQLKLVLNLSCSEMGLVTLPLMCLITKNKFDPVHFDPLESNTQDKSGISILSDVTTTNPSVFKFLV